MRPTLVSFFAGTLFGFGLTVSRMIDPAKVLGFLDIAGDWDPSLALVMAGALTVMPSPIELPAPAQDRYSRPHFRSRLVVISISLSSLVRSYSESGGD